MLAEDSEEEGEQMLLQVEQLLQRIELLEQECKREALTIDLPDAGEDGDEVTIYCKAQPRTTVSQDVQTRFSVQLAFAKFLSKIKENF